jgi:hypothetical protein
VANTVLVKAIIVFAAMAVLDFMWAKYTVAVTNKQPV